MECEECGDAIPAARVRLTGSHLCVGCQQIQERLGLAPRYRMEVLGGRDVDSFEDSGAMVSKIAPRRVVGPISDAE